MSDLKQVLDRGLAGYAPAADGLERTLARSRRRLRNQRVGAAVLALVVCGGALLGLWEAFRPAATRAPTPIDRPSTPLTGTLTPSRPAPPVPMHLQQVTVAQGASAANAGFVGGDRLLPGGETLASPADSPLTGWITPVASASNGKLYYAAWSAAGESGGQSGVPEIRIHDLASGADTILAQPAMTFAVRGGRVAYIRVTGQNADGQTVGQVFVREPGGQEHQWTNDAAPWLVAGWAGDHVLVYQELDGESLRLWALDGPGRMRTLVADTNVNVVAISPDGRAAFVAEGDGDTCRMAVVDVATGAERGALDLCASTLTGSTGGSDGSATVPSASYGGSWSGDLVVARGGDSLLVFRVRGSTISVAEALDLRPYEMYETIFDATPDVVAGWTRVHGGVAPIRCDLSARSCTVGPKYPVLYRVYDPSRPQLVR
jgi:hypothetical protein